MGCDWSTLDRGHRLAEIKHNRPSVGMYHRSRNGCRGGRDQFDWEEIRNDKHRQNYLGNSVKAPLHTRGGKDIFWYNKEKAGDALNKLQSELRERKERESKLLEFYLVHGFGAKPPEHLLSESLVRKSESPRDDAQKASRTNWSSSGEIDKESKKDKRHRKR